ncbi:sulfatase-like hydrolase/transferase [Halorussus lipolyticus]|uniref:sulfatase-like hydrolase/transferase n=1 Tax=Halorussus lipolyticus TaxID=3034024 RepID=UPI0023E76625|nr:sulfatase-like hydrolase/transferase [Halorussus sp. DT80]
MNLGLVVLDTLRYDVYDDVMGDLSSLADHTFERTYSTSRWTVPAHASLFTGLYPSEVGVGARSRHLTTSRRTLAERLAGEGYDTVALSNNIHIDSFFDFDRGFETLHRGPALEDRPEADRSDFDWEALFSRLDGSRFRNLRAAWEILHSDADLLPTLRTAVEMYRSAPVNEATNDVSWAFDAMKQVAPADDQFLFANLMACHYPYDPPGEYADCEPLNVPPYELTLRENPVTDDEHARQWESYRGAARYLDDELPNLLADVDWDMLFVVSDHGELFGEHDLRGHEYGVYDELVRVPAVAIGNEVPAGTTTEVTSLLDVHRTLLETAGVDVPDDVRGRNLFEDDLTDREVYAESSGCGHYSPDATGLAAKIPASWDDPHYLLMTDDAAFRVDKDGERAFDPETDEEIPDRADDLRERVEALRESRGDHAGEAGGEVTDEIADRLEHLGYA